MEQNSSNNSIQNPRPQLQGEHDSGLRSDATNYEQIEADNARRNDEAKLYRDSVHQADEAEREKRNEIEAGQQLLKRITKGNAGTDELAQVFARFDAKSRSVQPCEFYEYNSRDYQRNGFI